MQDDLEARRTSNVEPRTSNVERRTSMWKTLTRTEHLSGLPPESAMEKAEAFAVFEGYRVRARPDALRLRKGVPLALHREMIAHEFRLQKGEGETTRLDLRVRALFWPEALLHRFIDRRLEAFSRFTGLRTGPGPSATGRFGAPRSPVRWSPFASFGLALVLASLPAWAFGWLAVEGALDGFLLRAERVEALGETFLPGASAVRAFPLATKMASGLFFALPLGFLAGLLMIPFLVAAEIHPAAGRGVIPVAVLGGAALAALASPGGAFPASLLLAFSPPLAVLGYGFAARPRLGDQNPVSLASHAAAALVAAGLWAILLLAATGGSQLFVRIRDRLLLPAPGGEAMTELYYRTTLLPAQAVQAPWDSNREKAFLALAGPRGVIPWLPEWCARNGVHLARRPPEGDLLAELPRGGWDLVWVEDEFLSNPEAPALRRIVKASRAPVVLCSGPGEAPAPEDVVVADRGGSPSELQAALGRALRSSVAPWGLAALSLAGLALLAVVGPALLWTAAVAVALWGGFEARAALRERGRMRAGQAAFAAGAVLALVLLAAVPVRSWPGPGAFAARSMASDPPPWEQRLAELHRLLGAPAAETRYEAARVLAEALSGMRQRAVAGEAGVAAGEAGAAPFRAARDYLGEPSRFAALADRLGDPDLRVRMWSAAALGHLADPRAVEPLRSLLGSADRICARTRAAEALGRIGDPRATAALRAVVLDEREPWYLRQAARNAMRP
jgi:hypothetical protein